MHRVVELLKITKESGSNQGLNFTPLYSSSLSKVTRLLHHLPSNPRAAIQSVYLDFKITEVLAGILPLKIGVEVFSRAEVHAMVGH